MTGNNSMTLCPALMTEIVQHYFETVLFAEGKAPKITSVKGSDSNAFQGNGFVVTMEAAK